MDLFLNALKGQVNTLNIVVLLFGLSVIAGILNRRKTARIIFVTAFLLFVLTFTEYLPYYLVHRMESEYSPFDATAFSDTSEQIFIHVLGGGYTFDARLPASAQLSPISLGRLTEGLRISNQIRGSKLVCSGWRVSGSASMAVVMKRAAISLGVDSARIEVLEEPGTTEEEAITFVRTFGKDVTLILVTDAIHMKRALAFFRQQGVDPQPAPTNYLAREHDNPHRFRWMPSVENPMMMDRVLREWLGAVKAGLIAG